MKICCDCKIEKTNNSFYKDKNNRDGLYSRCKECKSLEKKTKYYGDADHRQKAYLQYIGRKFGVTPCQYAKMIDDQKDSCALCRAENTGTRNRKNPRSFEFKRRMHIDHDHGTGIVRGLLCHHCNTSLGHYEKIINVIGTAKLEAYRNKGNTVDYNNFLPGLLEGLV